MSGTVRGKEHRNHHYIPQWYLRQFGSKQRIGIYDKRAGSFSIKRPQEVAFEVGLYDLDHPQLPRTAFEKVLSNVESLSARAVRKAIASGLDALSIDEREDIAAFVATQYLRVPSQRRAVGRHLADRLDRVRASLSDEEIREVADQDLSTREIELIRGPTLSEDEPPGVMAYGISLALTTFVEELLRDYRWLLLTVEPGELITSDRPVLPMTDHASDGSSSVFCDVPLDGSHVLLLLSGDGGNATAQLGGPDRWFLDASGEPSLRAFQNINFMKADRLVFGHADNPIWEAIGTRP